MNVTLLPEHIVLPGFAVILTLAVTFEVTFMVMEFEVAGEPVAQLAFDVSTQVMASPFARVVEVYVEFVAPEIFVPFFFH